MLHVFFLKLMLHVLLLIRVVWFLFASSPWEVFKGCQEMEVEALEKKGHRAFAKAIKSFNSSERHKRSKRLVP